MRDGWTAGFATWGDEDWIGRAPCLLVANMSSAFSGLQGDTPMSCVDGCPSHGTALPGALQKALGAQRMDPSTVIAECGQKKESARAHSFFRFRTVRILQKRAQSMWYTFLCTKGGFRCINIYIIYGSIYKYIYGVYRAL